MKIEKTSGLYSLQLKTKCSWITISRQQWMSLLSRLAVHSTKHISWLLDQLQTGLFMALVMPRLASKKTQLKEAHLCTKAKTKPLHT